MSDDTGGKIGYYEAQAIRPIVREEIEKAVKKIIAAQQSVQADECPYCHIINIPLRPKNTAYGVCPNCGTRR